MPHVADLLGSGSLIPFALLAGPAARTELTSVAAVESLRALEHVPSGALAVVTGRATPRAAGYQVDVAIRTAAERGLPALLLIGVTTLPLTAVHLATRAGVAVLSVPEDVDVAKVVLHLGQVIRGDAADALARADAALAVLRAPGDSPTELLARVGEALGRPLTLTDEPDSGEPIWVAGRCRGGVVGPKDDAVRLVLPAVAAAVSLQRTRALERETAPGAARAEVVAELIVSERSQAGQLAERARMLGFPVDEVHTVVRVRTGAGASTAVGPGAGMAVGVGAAQADLAEDRRLAETLALHVHQARHPTHERWTAARLAADLLLVASSRTELPEQRIREAVAHVRAELLAEHPAAELHFGIGTAHRGIDGLRQSTLEAQAALDVAVRKRVGVHAFDATGLSRILAAVSGSPLSRRAVEELLAPLDTLGPAEAAEAITTLGAYLDARGSLKAAATRLRLHPNTVGYRIRRITTRLGADLDDPDTSFALQLACRVRLQD
ncbi:PucR family transcriptional regulator [Streptacidiphilus jiangxiensis]|uniref:PucR C-terminal helix-turn-helix domain-containing protein n=1 Tax=Streptacidiphilus jiangxiensis TaxID=235985 RepID=A0A1H7TT17_STRJI|nr:PucR family transcriptional regulator [Streptacidiphilus jiangxiensis]SEL87881.1 PucR C-terminal helix-turn-helix domain-containing protein [Streptacidiphilus jiangxiensis]